MLITILGRQPELGLAELESLAGAEAVTSLDGGLALVNLESLPQSNLGGVLKIAKILQELPSANPRQMTRAVIQSLGERLQEPSTSKLTIGLSAYGLKLGARQLFGIGLELKKVCRRAGRAVRLVPNKTPILNSAQVLHNKLTGPGGAEFIFASSGGRAWLAQTVSVQDIDAYAVRDHGRPRRDAFVGMLPPKLAQIMLNLAQVKPGMRILDPFCGTGVVLQEAALMGCSVKGTDMDLRMVEFTQENMLWLKNTYGIKFNLSLGVADATEAKWDQPLDSVVCETYLGRPLSSLPSPSELAGIRRNCDFITRSFLENLHSQLKPGTRLCVAVPAWRSGKTFLRLPVLDDLSEIGYNRVRFKHAGQEGRLTYYREGQIVGRELLVLTV